MFIQTEGYPYLALLISPVLFLSVIKQCSVAFFDGAKKVPSLEYHEVMITINEICIIFNISVK